MRRPTKRHITDGGWLVAPDSMRATPAKGFIFGVDYELPPPLRTVLFMEYRWRKPIGTGGGFESEILAGLDWNRWRNPSEYASRRTTAARVCWGDSGSNLVWERVLDPFARASMCHLVSGSCG